MVIIGKGKLIGALFFSFALILVTAVWAYIVGMHSALKSDSELVLFFGFIGAGLQLAVLIIMLIYAKRKENDFLMIAKAIQLNGVLSEARAQKLGNLGSVLQEALNEAYRITEQKSLKIAGLYGLVSAVLQMVDHPVLAVSLTGEILDFSPKAHSDTGCKKGDLLSDIAPTVSLKEAFQKTELSRGAIQQGEHIVCVPVFSAAGNLSFFLVDLSQQPIVTKMMENVKHLMQKTEPEKNRRNPLFKLFRK